MNKQYKNPRIVKKKKRVKAPSLHQCPQKKGVCLQVFTTSPKKPNSANRKVARVKLTNGETVTCYIPGEGHRLQNILLFWLEEVVQKMFLDANIKW